MTVTACSEMMNQKQYQKVYPNINRHLKNLRAHWRVSSLANFGGIPNIPRMTLQACILVAAASSFLHSFDSRKCLTIEKGIMVVDPPTNPNWPLGHLSTNYNQHPNSCTSSSLRRRALDALAPGPDHFCHMKGIQLAES